VLGALAFVVIVVDFFRTNAAISRSALRGAGGFAPGYTRAMALALQTAFITVCINSIFYEIMYIAIFWNLITLNRMLYFACGAGVTAPVIPPERIARLWSGRRGSVTASIEPELKGHRA
jgi:hypothetical protein